MCLSYTSCPQNWFPLPAYPYLYPCRVFPRLYEHSRPMLMSSKCRSILRSRFSFLEPLPPSEQPALPAGAYTQPLLLLLRISPSVARESSSLVLPAYIYQPLAPGLSPHRHSRSWATREREREKPGGGSSPSRGPPLGVRHSRVVNL